ncbi:hypothetical protein LOZ12_005552 [Ophidiomyces ophidiicola]|uniref:Uncharacterized protein n=1 Tax=Ophidiomyces ophidiicola TaxID=1387563 RepID=A0ACB8UVP6_9EURO|nr:hypothetical protein LOZ64_006002 [Ophidiomyces ophidiicola]KAI1946307.1 hypothetical protein LOZ62_003417 [Ophidiomyces ophidiicola]KAI1950122.1 hypothetical protein LOZ59_005937 [Ophidiomyces ophidiicola]KAI1967933.1 hypothetical protein LOZ56_005308 [Ophidiomyces ophidiicola]KAI2001405.1 hypothetical protein LOZ50_005701 [Ophidiomyces ophidiicola]
MDPVDTSQRLERLRELMRERSVDVYVVPSEDSHQSEYIAPCDGRRAFISGFTGSAGCAIISMSKAALSTDGRYFNQASKQLDSNWFLLKRGIENVPTWQEWTAEQAEGGKVVGVDPSLITAAEARKLSDTIKVSGGSLLGVEENLVDIVWGADRPARPNEPVKVHPLEFAGKAFQDKISDLRKELVKRKKAGIVISTLDEIAWLFNLRGADIPFNPVFFSYAIVTQSAADLYVNASKIAPDVKEHLSGYVSLKPYESIFDNVKLLSQSLSSGEGAPQKFLLPDKASWSLNLALGGEDKVEEARSPISDAKAIKNAVELEGMRACHIRDGAALSKYFAWLENELVNKKTVLSEVDVSDKLKEIRSAGQYFVGLSFDTISSTGANAAIIHYRADRESCPNVDPNAIYLCDSGAQYLDGTTDTTRTFHFGEPTEMEKKTYTLVLKGMISIDTAIFPKGVTGYAIDAFARQHLWRYGLDYLHGTGHGVGSYLNVHEGPMGIGPRVQFADVAIAAGHVLSDEPGYYEDGNFGIRIENIVVAKEVKTPHKFADKQWLGFEHVTMTPLCQKLIDTALLTPEEMKWVNDYHQEVWEKTNELLANDELTTAWLKRETSPM